jgi:N utilization substance protein B
MSRKVAREKTFQLAFEYAFIKQQNPLTLEDFLLLEKIEEEDKNYIRNTYNGLVKHYDEILTVLERNLKNYTLGRIYKVDLAILLLAIYEMKWAKETAPSIIINEAVELAKKYSTEKSFSFINGVLGSVLGECENGA